MINELALNVNLTGEDLLRRTEVTAFLAHGRHKATWSGVPLLRRGNRRVMGAFWRLGPRQVGPLQFLPGDLCLELFDSQLDFNVFEIHRPRKGPGSRYKLQGWYVNLAAAAQIQRHGGVEKIAYTDWELDYIVEPDGKVTLLDAAAYDRLPQVLSADRWQQVQQARAALEARLYPDPAGFLQELYGAAAAGPGEDHLLAMVRHYGLPVAVHGDTPRRVGFSGAWSQAVAAGQRVGEALFALDQGAGQTLLHGKKFYPDGLVRLPGGGINAGEEPDAAAVRETAEETGLSARVVNFAAYISVPLDLAGTTYAMPTYVFQMHRLQPGGLPPPHPEEQIDWWEPLAVDQLAELAWQLARLQGDWAEWGRYRAVQHWAAYSGLAAPGRGRQVVP